MRNAVFCKLLMLSIGRYPIQYANIVYWPGRAWEVLEPGSVGPGFKVALEVAEEFH